MDQRLIVGILKVQIDLIGVKGTYKCIKELKNLATYIKYMNAFRRIHPYNKIPE